MNGTRAVIWIIGVCLVLAAAVIFFFATGLSEWIPFSIAAAAVLLFIGLAVMGFAEKSRGDHGHGGHTDVNVNEGHHGHH